MDKSRQVFYLRGLFAKWVEQDNVNVSDIQQIDFDAEVDGKLDYSENKRAMMEKYHYCEEPREEEYAEAAKEQIREIENFEDAKFKESVKTLSGGSESKYFEILKNNVLKVAEGYANAYIVEGKGGLGKTYEVLRTLAEKEVDYTVFSSYSTPLSFYHLLYENNGKVLVLDDFEGILGNSVGVNILKSALWSATKVRQVSYHSTSDKLTIPSTFEFTGRVIFCVNKFGKTEELNALKSRALYDYLDFSIKDIKSIIKGIAKTGTNEYNLSKEECDMVGDYIIENSDEATGELNLRTLIKGYGCYAYAKVHNRDYKKELDSLLKPDEEKQLLKKLIGDYLKVKEACKEWCELTGKSRATFYNLKKEMGMSRGWNSPIV